MRGQGLMVGVGVDPDIFDRAHFVARSRDAGLLMTTAGPDAIRLVPPLTIGTAHVDHAIGIIREILADGGSES